MYLKQLKLKNTGPIEHIDIECQFDDEGSPQPVIFVGKNGSGKSIVTSHIVNALIDANGVIFDNADVEKGKVYKLRSPSYIRHGTEYSTAEVHLTNSFSVYETQLTKLKKEFEEPLPDYLKWDKIDQEEYSHYHSNFQDDKPMLKDCLNKATHLFFPPNRFEEPAWLNELNLRNKASYTSLNTRDRLSDRPVVNYAPLRRDAALTNLSAHKRVLHQSLLYELMTFLQPLLARLRPHLPNRGTLNESHELLHPQLSCGAVA